MERRTHRAITALTAALVVAACGTGTGPDGDGAEPITRLPRDLTAAESRIVERTTGFALDFMGRAVRDDPRPNVVLSPFSLSMALGMTLNGAAAGTFDAMRSTLGFEGLTQAEINAGYEGLVDLLTGLDPDVRLAVGNAVWANQGFPFHQTFFDAVAASFDARVETLDFAAPSTLTTINDWAADATDGMIPQVLDGLDPDLVMLLMNAVAFEGAWTVRFDPDDTAQGDFRRADGSIVRTPMMHARNVELPLGYGDGWAAVELPYGGGAWSMVVVVPSGDVRDLVSDLTPDTWDAVLASLRPQEVDLVAIPKFSIAHDAFLNPVLEDMGMGVAFGPGADFSNLSPRGDELCIDYVRQKTFIEVDEEGTRAAAVTTVGVGVVSFTGLVADHPFFFAIRERLSGTLLFTGIVGDPTHGDSGPAEGQGTCH